MYQKEPVITYCFHCGVEIRKPPSQAKLGRGKHCGKPECKSAYYSGENNPFWNKNHTDETRAKMRAKRAENGSDYLKGVKKKPMTKEHREKRSEVMRRRWLENRETMLSYIPCGEDHHWGKPHGQRRHRFRFTERQRREWTGIKCEWCGSRDNLILDHILPIAAGGTCVRENSQTLCQPCNLWKMWYIDRPLAVVVKATSGG